jgi:large subunit ribosomal protein L9
MKVILIQDVIGLGEEGETREVARGYARNFLFPKGFAVDDTSFNRNRKKEQQKKIELRKVKKREEAQQLADALSNLSINIPAAVGKNEKLFGAIHEQDIMKVLDEQGYQIEKKNILLGEPIKQTGAYKVAVKVYEDIEAELKVWVVKED